MENKREFVSGVVEGFYGRPWSSSQRCKLFYRLKEMGLNTYLYAPKDDLKHRQMWRDLYTEEEAKQIKILIDSSNCNKIRFVYALSPGLDISFSSSNDIYLLKNKMNQVLELGCNAFSLLFDDIHPNLSEVDKTVFHSFAYAQSVITNEIFEFLNKPSFFLFCPTEYCSTRAIPTITKSEYLKTIGETLTPEIDIMWTGPKVISKFITVESILKLSKVLRRSPIIWDNLHANDYDQRRLFLGPYYGRSSKLIPHLRGVLINPNCEFESNFVAIHTLGNWIRSYQWSFHCTTSDEMENEYEAPKALELALSDWLKLFYQKETKEEPSTLNDFGGTDAIGELSCRSDEHSQNENIKLFSHSISTKSDDQSNKESDGDHQHISSPKNKELSEKSFESSLNIEKVSNETVSLPIKSNLPVNKKLESEISLTRQDDYKKESNYHFNPYFPVGLLNADSEIYPQMELTDKVEKVSHSSDMILDSIINANQLTPMETEENTTDTDNVIDSMAMQVDDSRYENTYETMDIIDEMDNNSNSDTKRESKDPIPLKTVKSEMDCLPFNRSTDYTETLTGVIDDSRLTVDDLYLLVNMFFLPYHHGPLAINILKLINWLKSHSFVINRRNRTVSEHPSDRDSFGLVEERFKSYEWHDKAKEFIIEVEKIRTMVDRFTAIPNRTILYDLYPYLQEIRYVISILISYVKWMGYIPGFNESLMNEDHEPWVFRGGLISEFQRMFPLEGSKDFFPNKVSFIENSYNHLFYNSINGSDSKIRARDDFSCHYNNPDSTSVDVHSAVYIVRPYDLSNEKKLYELCLEILCSQLNKDPNVEKKDLIELKSENYRNLPGDRYLGSYLQFCSDTCVVLEDDNENICGYALGTNRIKEFLKFRYEQYNFQMRKKYEQYRIKSSDIVLSNEDDHSINLAKPNKISAINLLIDGFNETCHINDFDFMYGSNKCLIKMDLLDSCKLTDFGSVNCFGLKLLKGLCSFLKSRMSKPKQVDINSPCPGHGSRSACDNNSIVPHEENDISDISLPLAAFCELDNLTSVRSEPFYESCGFELCNIDRTTSLMSRHV